MRISRLQRLAEEFSLDDHTYWPAPPERNDKQPIPPNAMMRTIQKKWDDVSPRMQTELTMGRESGQEDGDLVDELAVEDRERYDYKEFLRKFAVLKEETEIDPDSFGLCILQLWTKSLWKYAVDRTAGMERSQEDRGICDRDRYIHVLQR